jgi:restriction system protein
MTEDINYYRLMLGAQSVHFAECFEGGFIGVDVEIEQDLTGEFPDDWREFNKKYRPIYLEIIPGKTKIAAGLACGALWTVAKGIRKGDIVLCPDGTGTYRVAEVIGDYEYRPEAKLYHSRSVRWLDTGIKRSDMSQPLKNSTGSIGTFCNITKYTSELAVLIGSQPASGLIATDETVEDPSVFALEKHLEDFLVQNWQQTELGTAYDIFEDENGTGQQYPSDTGPIDILAVSKDKKELLVVELKKGRASDSVIGQIQRYMGYVQEELAEDGQMVRGIIIALEDDLRIQRALAVTSNIEFYRYQVSFKLFKE